MARYTGKDAIMKIAGTAIGERNNFSFDISREVVTGTAQGETWASADYGDGTVTGDLTTFFDPDDTAGQLAMESAVIAGTKLTSTFYIEGDTTGDWELSGSIVLSSMGGTGGDNNTYNERTYAWTMDGAPTIGTAS